jgi:hypothetical protein
MENNEIKYCLRHGIQVHAAKLLNRYAHFPLEMDLENGEGYCFGPFAECPPPPALTEQQWEQIFETREGV